MVRTGKGPNMIKVAVFLVAFLAPGVAGCIAPTGAVGTSTELPTSCNVGGIVYQADAGTQPRVFIGADSDGVCGCEVEFTAGGTRSPLIEGVCQ